MAIKVDLLPTERKKFGFDPLLAILVLLIVVCVVVFHYVGQIYEKNVVQATASLTEVTNSVEEAKKGLPEIERLQKENSELENQINAVKTLRYDPIRYSNLLDEISALLPNNMWVSNISIEPSKNSVQLTGVAVEIPGIRPLESVSGFMKNANKSKYFRGATITGTSRGTANVGQTTYTSYSWTIDMNYDPKAAEQTNPDAVEKGPGAMMIDSSVKGRS